MQRLFTYGSLMCEDIMFRVAGKCTLLGDATLKNYRCLCVRGEEYPAIVEQSNFFTRGVLYDNISEDGFKMLDEFEGEMYARKQVAVARSSGEFQKTFTYILIPAFSHLLSEKDWHFDTFLKSGKDRFIAKYIGFSKIDAV